MPPNAVPRSDEPELIDLASALKAIAKARADDPTVTEFFREGKCVAWDRAKAYRRESP